MIPFVLILAATVSAAAVAYGAEPELARYAHGIELIMLARRLQWPLVTLSLIACVALIGLVISGRRRAWWLIGLAPVLALFAQRFSANPVNAYAAIENPVFVAPDAAVSFLGDSDYVVGVVFEGEPYAYPYAGLYGTPVVLQSEHDQRLILLWSAFANRAVAFRADHDLRARDLDVVSTPANALLVYNARLGEFINGVTGLTTRGQRPSGTREPVDTTRTTWVKWRSTHPQTRVMLPAVPIASAPRQPAPPKQPMPARAGGVDPAESSVAADAKIVFIKSDPPLAVWPEDVGTVDAPLNASAGDVSVLVFREPDTGRICAFDRRVDADLRPRFASNTDAARADVAFVDADTDTGWTAAGFAVDGMLKGQRLETFEVEEDLYWGVMKHWYPALRLSRTPTAPRAAAAPAVAAAATRP